MISNLIEQVKQFRTAVGLPIGSGQNCRIETHRAVIKEELIEAADGMTDTLVTLAGLALDGDEKQSLAAKRQMFYIYDAMIATGFNPEACMNIVHEANMSKLCREQDVKPTQQKYGMAKVDSYVREVSEGVFAVYSEKCQTCHHGKFYPAHKLLKAYNWHEPDWSDMRKWADPDLCELMGE